MAKDKPWYCGGDRCAGKGDEACWECLGIDDEPPVVHNVRIGDTIVLPNSDRFKVRGYGGMSGCALILDRELK